MKVVIGYRFNEARLRRPSRCQCLGDGAGVLPIKHDVTDSDGSGGLLGIMASAATYLLVNNAAYKTLAQAEPGKGAEECGQRGRRQLRRASTTASQPVCPTSRPGEGAHIVTTASMSGVVPGVLAGVYTATKIAAVGMMEALRVELEGTNIGTSAFCPGGVMTDNRPEAATPPPPGRRRVGRTS